MGRSHRSREHLNLIDGSGRAPREPIEVLRDRFDRRLRAHAYELVAIIDNESRRRYLTGSIKTMDLPSLMCLVTELDSQNKRHYEALMQPGSPKATA